MKEKWMAPRTVIEEFTPNEYVAACWNIACIQGKYGDVLPWGSKYDYDYKENGRKYLDHTGSCSSAANNVISDNGGKITVRENSSDQGWLDCEIQSPTGWGNVTPGMEVIWVTYNDSKTKKWTHKGIAETINTLRPNMS